MPGGDCGPALVDSAPFHTWTFPDGSPCALFFRCPEGYLLRFPGVADFGLSADGRHAETWPEAGASREAIEHAYLNQVLPLALNRQGEVVVHASAVATGDGALAFVGESGRGKSTLAASFAREGMAFLTDDGLCLTADASGCRVRPGPPSLRLLDDSREAILPAPERGARRAPAGTKVRVPARGGLRHERRALPLRHVFFLGEGRPEGVEITKLSAREAFVDLLKHSFVLDVEDREAMAVHFEKLGRLALLPLFSRLDYPRRFEALEEVRGAILRHSGSVRA